MFPDILGLLIGLFFGAFLFLGGLADPDKIIGTLRLRDLHALRTFLTFVLVSMLGVWALEMAQQYGWGVAPHFSVKPAAILAMVIGGLLLGVGFGLTGYCPGTGLACAVAGHLDAVVAVVGMLAGAFVFILIYPSVIVPIDAIANYGKVMLPELTGVSRMLLVLPTVAVGGLVLILTRKWRGIGGAERAADEEPET